MAGGNVSPGRAAGRAASPAGPAGARGPPGCGGAGSAFPARRQGKRARTGRCAQPHALTPLPREKSGRGPAQQAAAGGQAAAAAAAGHPPGRGRRTGGPRPGRRAQAGRRGRGAAAGGLPEAPGGRRPAGGCSLRLCREGAGEPTPRWATSAAAGDASRPGPAALGHRAGPAALPPAAACSPPAAPAARRRLRARARARAVPPPPPPPHIVAAAALARLRSALLRCQRRACGGDSVPAASRGGRAPARLVPPGAGARPSALSPQPPPGASQPRRARLSRRERRGSPAAGRGSGCGCVRPCEASAAGARPSTYCVKRKGSKTKRWTDHYKHLRVFVGFGGFFFSKEKDSSLRSCGTRSKKHLFIHLSLRNRKARQRPDAFRVATPLIQQAWCPFCPQDPACRNANPCVVARVAMASPGSSAENSHEWFYFNLCPHTPACGPDRCMSSNKKTLLQQGLVRMTQ